MTLLQSILMLQNSLIFVQDLCVRICFVIFCLSFEPSVFYSEHVLKLIEIYVEKYVCDFNLEIFKYPLPNHFCNLNFLIKVFHNRKYLRHTAVYQSKTDCTSFLLCQESVLHKHQSRTFSNCKRHSQSQNELSYLQFLPFWVVQLLNTYINKINIIFK